MRSLPAAICAFGLVLLGLVSSAEPLRADEGPPPLAGEALETERQVLLTLKTLYEEAVSKNELDRLLPHLDPNFSFVTFTDSEFDISKTTFEQFKTEWNATRTTMLEGGSYEVELVPERSIIYPTFAFARGMARHKIKQGSGKVYELEGQWTATLRKADGTWKVLRAHSSIGAFTNPIIEDFVKTKLLQFSIGAFAIGVAVTLVSSRLLRRRRQA